MIIWLSSANTFFVLCACCSANMVASLCDFYFIPSKFSLMDILPFFNCIYCKSWFHESYISQMSTYTLDWHYLCSLFERLIGARGLQVTSFISFSYWAYRRSCSAADSSCRLASFGHESKWGHTTVFNDFTTIYCLCPILLRNGYHLNATEQWLLLLGAATNYYSLCRSFLWVVICLLLSNSIKFGGP